MENIITPDTVSKLESFFTPENLVTLVIPVLVGIVVLKFLLSQIGCLWKIAVNAASGFVCLWLLNLASVYTGIVIEINVVTVLIAGFLGIPGIILLVLGQFL